MGKHVFIVSELLSVSRRIIIESSRKNLQTYVQWIVCFLPGVYYRPVGLNVMNHLHEFIRWMSSFNNKVKQKSSVYISSHSDTHFAKWQVFTSYNTLLYYAQNTGIVRSKTEILLILIYPRELLAKTDMKTSDIKCSLLVKLLSTCLCFSHDIHVFVPSLDDGNWCLSTSWMWCLW